MISSMKFDRSDLRMEVVGVFFAGNWIVQSSVYYKGKSYVFVNPILMTNKIDKVGLVEDGKRLFAGSINGDNVHLEFKCEGNANQFLHLEDEILSNVYGSLQGKCQVVDKMRVETYESRGHVLLERKVLL